MTLKSLNNSDRQLPTEHNNNSHRVIYYPLYNVTIMHSYETYL